MDGEKYRRKLSTMAEDLDGSTNCTLTFSDDKNNFYRYLKKIEQYLKPPEIKQSLPSLPFKC